MKKGLMRFGLIALLGVAFTGQASTTQECNGAYVDTIAIEGTRVDIPGLSKTLLISFKDASGNLMTCGMGSGRYVYLKARENPEVFDAMLSVAFMARANNLPVRYMVLADRAIASARELSFLQLQSDVPGFYDTK
ncbi:hypothetical protein [Pseudoalteromonas rubra]|uniref:hypothetical protein n=1 Tax=Pseudoalteromonas rubra TaxID=43658 RepID=UPI000F7B3AC4|nr:hypothetical protein [Pseudoalteromonas rubra]